MKKILALLFVAIIATCVAYLSRPKVVVTTLKEEYKSPVVDKGYYFKNISIKGDSIICSEIYYYGVVGDFDNEQVTQKWVCTNSKVKRMITNATIDFHQQPGELKMMADGKGLTNEKYIVNENFANYIIIEDNRITAFRK